MSKKTVRLSNDNIPEDELLLAKLLQNAGLYGLVACKGSAFKDENGWSTGTFNQDTSAACCALGAASLSPDTSSAVGSLDGVDTGNDANDYDTFSNVWSGTFDDDTSAIKGLNIGAAFELALRPE